LARKSLFLEGKSAIWSINLELAWKKMETDFVKGPIQLRDKDLAEFLNKSHAQETDLDPESFFLRVFRKDQFDVVRCEMETRSSGENRASHKPNFAMWVDNAEMLERHQ